MAPSASHSRASRAARRGCGRRARSDGRVATMCNRHDAQSREKRVHGAAGIPAGDVVHAAVEAKQQARFVSGRACGAATCGRSRQRRRDVRRPRPEARLREQGRGGEAAEAGADDGDVAGYVAPGGAPALMAAKSGTAQALRWSPAAMRARPRCIRTRGSSTTRRHPHHRHA